MEMGTIYGTEMGIMPGDAPFLTRTFEEALCKLREMKHVSLVLERGEYHFYPQYGTKGNFWISNHHKCAERTVDGNRYRKTSEYPEQKGKKFDIENYGCFSEKYNL